MDLKKNLQNTSKAREVILNAFAILEKAGLKEDEIFETLMKMADMMGVNIGPEQLDQIMNMVRSKE